MAPLGFQQRQLSSTRTVLTESGGDSEIARFYRDRVVFITGGTGFVGKVLLEKLLRSCPGLKRVYLLMRSSRTQEPEARLATLLSSQVFERLKQEQSDALQKVEVVCGDLELPNLGLSATDLATLVEEVSVVFHSAATAKLVESLKAAVAVNLLGTRRVLDLCKQMRKLSALVHMSTAYCNCDFGKELQESVYWTPVDTEKVIEAAESLDIVADTPKEFLFGMPNAYTLTKRLAECVLRDERGATPVAVVRPSIATSAWREPFPGWSDDFMACTGIVMSLGQGLLPSIMARKNCIADVIPVDMVANTLICAAWDTADVRQPTPRAVSGWTENALYVWCRSSGLPGLFTFQGASVPELEKPTGHFLVGRIPNVRVYHCTSGAESRQTWADLTGELKRAIAQYPLPGVVRYPKFVVTSNELWHNVILWCLDYVPALAADLVLMTNGRDPRFIHDHTLVRKHMDAVRYFTTHGWLFKSNNLWSLHNDLSSTDKKTFGIDIQNIEWGDTGINTFSGFTGIFRMLKLKNFLTHGGKCDGTDTNR